jgi:uncharacterized membrane protein YphA (DoxX/SURF4 family)
VSTSSSVFPAGLQGAAILILRGAAALLMVFTSMHFDTFSKLTLLGSILVAILLVLGLFTRLAALACAALTMVVAIMTRGDQQMTFGLLAFNAVALSFLGGGAYSVDARMFGRRVLTMR